MYVLPAFFPRATKIAPRCCELESLSDDFYRKFGFSIMCGCAVLSDVDNRDKMEAALALANEYWVKGPDKLPATFPERTPQTAYAVPERKYGCTEGACVGGKPPIRDIRNIIKRTDALRARRDALKRAHPPPA
jgi:hypothetical protein